MSLKHVFSGVRFSAVVITSLCVSFAVVGSGCSSTTTVTVPVAPEVDLGTYGTIGLMTFASNTADGDLQKLCTQRFLEAMQQDQPGVRVLELGTESRVLNSVGMSSNRKWDAKVMQAVKETHGVDVLVLGRVDVEKSNPNVRVDSLFKLLSVKSDANVSLSAKLVETASGETMWTESATTTTTLASASMNKSGEGHFGMSDAEAHYGEMVGCLVGEVTDDFRIHYVKRRVPKEQTQQTAVVEE